jgi:hypothetical protein
MPCACVITILEENATARLMSASAIGSTTCQGALSKGATAVKTTYLMIKRRPHLMTIRTVP